MVKEKIVYEVNGKIFDNKEDAIKEEQSDKSNQKRVANKYFEVLNTVNSLNNTVDDSNLFSVEITITDKEIVPEWYVEKPYYNVLVTLLKELNVKYSASEGDERRSAYFKIYPSNIDEIPSVDDLINYIDETSKKLEIEKQERINRILKR